MQRVVLLLPFTPDVAIGDRGRSPAVRFARKKRHRHSLLDIKNVFVDVAVGRPTLEDVFISLTGRALR